MKDQNQNWVWRGKSKQKKIGIQKSWTRRRWSIRQKYKFGIQKSWMPADFSTAASAAPSDASIKKQGSTIQTGMDRCINIKRKLSRQDTKMGNVAKINRVFWSQGTVQSSNTANRFELLADTSDEIPSAVLDT